MVADGPAPHRLRRGQPDVAVDGRLQRHRVDVVGGILADRDAAAPGCTTTVNLPSLRVDAFTVGLAGQVTGGRRSGLTFAPEAGSWRLRQVINKLITEDDLYGAVDAAFAEGWTRIKLYFLTGLPTETDEDTLGIAELARNCVALGRRHSRPGVGDGQRRRVRAQAAHAVPVVRPEHRRRAAAQGRPAAHGDRTRPRNVQLKWHDPAATVAEGIAQPRRPAHRAGRSSGCGATAARSRSGASTSTSAAGPTRWRPRACRSTGTSTATATRDEVLPWAHLTAGLHEDFLWDDWQAALAAQRGRGLPLDAVLRLRGVHRLRHRARRRLAGRRRPAAARAPARTSRAAASVPVVLLERAADEAAPALRQARQGPLHQPPRHGADRGSGRCAGPACPSRRAPGSRRGRG